MADAERDEGQRPQEPAAGAEVPAEASTEAPASEAPASEASASEAPASEAPASEAPASETSATEAPAVEAPAAKPVEFRVSGKTDVGLVREHNEDNFLVADLSTGSTDQPSMTQVPEAGMVFAVCDGMGGAAAGEVASQMAVDTILAELRESTPAPDRDGFALALVRSIERAGARIFEAANDDRSRRGMGTTSTVAALMDKTLFVGQVGDSRGYVLRRGELKLLTKDQSLVNQLIEAGQLTEDEAEAFEHSNIILQALGTTDQVSVDLTFLELRRGDRLMLCSDGLSGLVHGDVIRDVLAEYDDLSACCDRLIELAKAGGGHDNITVIVVEFDGEALVEPAETDLAGYQQYPLPFDASSDAGGSTSEDGAATFDAHAGGYADGDGLHEQGGGTMRYLVVAVALLALAFGIYYWSGGASGEQGTDPEGAMGAPGEVVTAAAEAPAPVEVVVRTDVEGGELHVDGASYGAPDGEKWMLDLPPGPHKLEALSGGNVVASSLVTVREGVPATVFLSMPEVGAAAAAEPTADSTAQTDEGADEGVEGAGDGTGDGTATEAELSAAEKRREARQKAREERRRQEREAAAAKAEVQP